ncbi:MAG TPA: histidine kinase dimerization/phosphoacceptor domain -containing protein [Caulobacteraceae bacterium]|jgi:two-component sensor histidine kinase|nr:histidine kinase dimerization/phosphoacceptor domain -containing protein [Caulobacteraceae bacterium]
MSLWNWLFNPSGLTAHGFCLSWAPGLVALHAGSDALIGLAYFSIPLALAWFVRERRDLAYSWIVSLFVAFILACGTTHLFSILTLWVPVYGVEGMVKAITAALSIATAIALWPLVPKLLALPSPDQLRELNADLERRVSSRTAELQAALEQRDLLLREVYHRVKNNLQTVDALLHMQARRTTDPEAREGLGDLRGRVFALGLVHQQLMGSENLTTFDIAPFLKELSTNILQGGEHDGVTLSVAACPLQVGLDFAIPLGLLVTELVTNSLKHAFPGGVGHIAVTLAKGEDDKVLLTIADNGRGQSEAGSGLGASIIKGLVAQLDAVMRVVEDDGLKTEILAAAPLAA